MWERQKMRAFIDDKSGVKYLVFWDGSFNKVTTEGIVKRKGPSAETVIKTLFTLGYREPTGKEQKRLQAEILGKIKEEEKLISEEQKK